MISYERMEKALHYLVDTDDSTASAFALVKKLEDNKKYVLGKEYLQAAGTVADRNAIAATSDVYQDYLEKIENAWADHKLLENKRATAKIFIDVYRTISANQRNG
jgi:hypothetical protein